MAFPPKIAKLLRKTKPTKPNQKPNQPSCLKPLGLSYFCELSLHTKFQLPRLCLSCISMVEDGEEKRRKEKKRRISSFNGYLSHSSSRVEFELGLGLRLTKILAEKFSFKSKENFGLKTLCQQCSEKMMLGKILPGQMSL